MKKIFIELYVLALYYYSMQGHAQTFWGAGAPVKKGHPSYKYL